MITAEQADKLLKNQAVSHEKTIQASGVSPAYQQLGVAITKNSYELRKTPPKAIYLKHFKADENPWTSPDGQKLAAAIFGPEKAPLIPTAWDILGEMPYQFGWSRRPFRSKMAEHLLEKRIYCFNAMAVACANGFHNFSVADTLRYDVYYSNRGNHFAPLFAAAFQLEKEDGPLKELAWDIFNGEDEIGATTTSIIQGLLMTNRPDMWELVEKLLLAAQREEGLRQSIFETVDQSSYGAFVHFVKLIREHDLARFSAVVRGIDTWFGFGWEAPKKKTINRALDIALECLEDDAAVEAKLLSKDNLEVYIAIWSVAIRDVMKALPLAGNALLKAERHQKLAAMYLLTQTTYTSTKVTDWAKAHFGQDILLDYYVTLVLPGNDPITPTMKEQLIAHGQSLPKEGKTFHSGVFEWLSPKITPEHFYNFLIRRASQEQLLELAEDLASIPSNSRETLMRRLFPNHYTYSLRYGNQHKRKPLDLKKDPWIRKVMHSALTDRNGSVLATGLNVLQTVSLEDEDIPILTDLLRRKGKELRGALIATIVEQPDERVKEFAGQLLPAKSADQRLAGLEILSVMKVKERLLPYVDACVAEFQERPRLSKNESVLLERFAPAEERNDFSLDNGFGVIDYENLRPMVEPKLQFVLPKSEGLVGRLLGKKSKFLFSKFVDGEKIHAAITSLAQLIADNGTHEYQITYRNGRTQTYLLQNYIGDTNPYAENRTDAEAIAGLPLSEKFQAWYAAAGLNDFELFFFIQYCQGKGELDKTLGAWMKTLTDLYYPVIPEVKSAFGDRNAWANLRNAFGNLGRLFYRAHADKPMMTQFQVDVFEDILARWPKDQRTKISYTNRWKYREEKSWLLLLNEFCPWVETFQNMLGYPQIKTSLLTRYYDLQQHYYTSLSTGKYPARSFAEVLKVSVNNSLHYNRSSPNTKLASYLYKKGEVSQDEMLVHGLQDPSFLWDLINAEALNATYKNPGLHLPTGLADELAKNMLSLELDRGDLATDATPYTSKFRRLEGVDYLVKLNERLGKDNLSRGYAYGTSSKKESFSSLIKVTQPAAVDTVESFSARAKETKITSKRWLEVAMYAPQWAPWIGAHLGLEELESAVWFFHAHASDYASKQKAGAVARYSPIEMQDFRDGAIDIDWFTEIYAAVGKKNWKLLHDASKYVTDGNGHRQIKLYSSILLGEVKITETLKKIKDKRDKIYVKGLGLVPLSRKIPRKDLLKRYELFQQFLQESKQFGNQRKESEKKAVQIGLENLARNAGYSDPVRFSWIMEGQSTQAIRDEAVVEEGNARVELIIDANGKADIKVLKDGKPQKAIPAKLKKHKGILRLKENKAKLRKQYSRTLKSLEKAMVDGQAFTVEEVREINEHPVVNILLDKLVFFHPEKQLTGFWRRGVLNDVNGKPYELKEDEQLRIAHPTDLYTTVQWDLFQRYAFDNKLVQPFKQIFRELYIPTANEKETSTHSSRYQGNQIQVKKTVALLTGRGWTVSYDSGLQKVDYKRGVISTLNAMADWYSASDIEAPALEEVYFYSRKNYKRLPIDEVDPILFSETMRDVDLVVSVAHAGQVDPEASHSSMEMRAALARESARLFRLENVEVKSRHIVITGLHGVYSLHLGSGMVAKNGLQLGIIPVQSQHRGRIFLPFVDDDPKSAEIISKMKMLAEDDRIKDPTVLAQLMK